MRPRDPGFYIFPMASGGFYLNNDDVTLHKGNLSSIPTHPNRGANQYPNSIGWVNSLIGR